MKTSTRRFLKLTIGVELKTQLVTAVKLRRGPANDNRDFEPVVRKAQAVKPSSRSGLASGTRDTTTRTTTSS